MACDLRKRASGLARRVAMAVSCLISIQVLALESALAAHAIAPTELYLQTAPFELVPGVSLGGKSKQVAKLVRFSDGRLAVLKLSPPSQPLASDCEVAAYRLDQLLGFNRVPVTVKRAIDGSTYSVQAYIPNLKPIQNEYALPASEIQSAVFFDTLIAEPDRHRGNIGLDSGGKIVLIDHGFSFGFWRLEDYKHKLLAWAKPTLSGRAKDHFMSLRPEQILSELEDLTLGEERRHALLVRIQELRRMIEMEPAKMTCAGSLL